MLGDRLIDLIESGSQNPSSEMLQKIRQLIAKTHSGIDDSSRGYSATHAAVKTKNFAALEILVLEGGASLSVKDNQGMRPKSYAEFDEGLRNKIDALRTENKRRRHTSQKHLHDLIREGKKRPVKARIASHPEEINETTYCQRNAGHIAALYYPKCMPWLIEAGLDLHAKDDMGDNTLLLIQRDKASRAVMMEHYKALFLYSLDESEQMRNLQHLIDEMNAGLTTTQRKRSVSQPNQALSRVLSYRNLGVADLSHGKRRGNRTAEDIIKDDSITQLKAYIEEHKASVQDFVEQAVQAQAVRVLAWLLEHRATLSRDLLTNITKEQATFWFRVLERLEYLTARRQDAAYLTELQMTQVHLQRMLIELGLTPTFSPHQYRVIPESELETLCAEQGLDLKLMEALCAICSGWDGDNNIYRFNAMQFKHAALGLLNLYSAAEVFTGLTALAPHLVASQKMMLFYFIKELVLAEAAHAYLDRHLYRDRLNALFSAMQLATDSAVYEALLTIINLQRKLYNPLKPISFTINGLLEEQGYRASRGTEAQVAGPLPKFIEAEQFAEACRAITLSFYQRLTPAEFGKNLWQKETKHHTSPNIVKSQVLFDNLQQYVVMEILKRRTLALRLEYILMIISALELLLEGDMPDLNSGMALLSALNTSSICRLKRTFAALPKGTSERLAAIDEKLAGANNYRGQRAIMREKPNSLPFLGVYLHDATGNSENRLLGASVQQGQFIDGLAKRKSRLSNVRAQSAITLLPILQSWQSIDENEMILLSHQIESWVLYLDNDVSIDYAYRFIAINAETASQCKISYGNGLYKDEAALEQLLLWLRDYIIRNQFKDLEKIESFTQLIKGLKLCEEADANQEMIERHRLPFMVWVQSYQTIALTQQFARLSLPVVDAGERDELSESLVEKQSHKFERS